MARKRCSYTIKERREAVAALRTHSQRQVERDLGIPRRTLRRWARNEAYLLAYQGPERTKSMMRGD